MNKLEVTLSEEGNAINAIELNGNEIYVVKMTIIDEVAQVARVTLEFEAEVTYKNKGITE